MKLIKVESVVWKEGKHYVAQCLNVDVSSFGATEKEALLNLTEALELYFEDMQSADISKVEAPTVVELTLQGA